MLSSTVPSEWARNLVRGAYDLHVHVAPDVMRRRVTDVQLARRCWDAGLGQPDNPPVEDGLALMADALHAAGFTDEEITTMIVDNSRLLAGADALRADPERM